MIAIRTRSNEATNDFIVIPVKPGTLYFFSPTELGQSKINLVDQIIPPFRSLPIEP